MKRKKEEVESIDHHDLDALEAEYIQLNLAELTDDVSIDPTGERMRTERLEEIEELVGEDMVREWGEQATQLAVQSGYASGKPYEP